MAITDLLKRRTCSPCSPTEKSEGTATSPVVTGCSPCSPCSPAENVRAEREPSDGLVIPDDQPVKLQAPAHEAIQAPSSEPVSGHLSWTDWIAEQCPLLPEDRQYVFLRLRTLPPRSAERAARRYVDTWHAAATAEPKPHAKDNRGRTAANRTLLALIR